MLQHDNLHFTWIVPLAVTNRFSCSERHIDRSNRPWTAQPREPKMNIYVGNLSYGVTETQLKALFEEFGEVTSANLIKDKYSGESKGFGFVEMDKQNEGEEAIKQLNGRPLEGRNLTVNLARPRNDRSNSRPRR